MLVLKSTAAWLIILMLVSMVTLMEPPMVTLMEPPMVTLMELFLTNS